VLEARGLLKHGLRGLGISLGFLGAAVGVQEELRAQMDNVSASLRRRKSYLLPAEIIVPTNALLPPQFALALVHLAARHCDGMDGRSLDEKVRTSAPGLAHICTRTRANVPQMCAATRAHLRRDSRLLHSRAGCVLDQAQRGSVCEAAALERLVPADGRPGRGAGGDQGAQANAPGEIPQLSDGVT
jgi:hypothetical protein